MNILELHTSHCEYLRARAVESGAELVTWRRDGSVYPSWQQLSSDVEVLMSPFCFWIVPLFFSFRKTFLLSSSQVFQGQFSSTNLTFQTCPFFTVLDITPMLFSKKSLTTRETTKRWSSLHNSHFLKDTQKCPSGLDSDWDIYTCGPS